MAANRREGDLADSSLIQASESQRGSSAQRKLLLYYRLFVGLVFTAVVIAIVVIILIYVPDYTDKALSGFDNMDSSFPQNISAKVDPEIQKMNDDDNLQWDAYGGHLSKFDYTEMTDR